MSINQIATMSGAAGVERRRAYLAPLFAYLLAHHFIPGGVAREAGERHGYTMTSVRLAVMKRGETIPPAWLVEECCAVIGKSVAEVMGDEWVERYGADGRGGTEQAPVRLPSTTTAATSSASSSAIAATPAGSAVDQVDQVDDHAA